MNVQRDYLWSYMDWARSNWNSGDLTALTERDLSIMSHGLPGECGEVMEVLQTRYGDPKLFNIENLTKELGDLFYYWCMLTHMFQLRYDIYYDFENSDELHKDFGLMYLSLGLGNKVGRVTEILKKRIRDGLFDKDKFTVEMNNVLRYWTAICRTFQIPEQDVLRKNREKIMDRKARGVMRGDGDNR